MKPYKLWQWIAVKYLTVFSLGTLTNVHTVKRLYQCTNKLWPTTVYYYTILRTDQRIHIPVGIAQCCGWDIDKLIPWFVLLFSVYQSWKDGMPVICWRHSIHQFWVLALLRMDGTGTMGPQTLSKHFEQHVHEKMRVWRCALLFTSCSHKKALTSLSCTVC